METHYKLPNVRLLWVPVYGIYCVRVDVYIMFPLFGCAFEVRDWLTELVGQSDSLLGNSTVLLNYTLQRNYFGWKNAMTTNITSAACPESLS